MSLFDVEVLREMFAQATNRYGDWRPRDKAADRLIAELGLGGAPESKLFLQLLDAAAERDALQAKLDLANGSLDALRNAINDYDGADRGRGVAVPVGRVIGIVADLRADKSALEAKLAALAEIHPFHQWGEDDGDVIWHCLPVSETPFHIGRPSDSDWPWSDEDMEDEEFTAKIGWSRLPLVNENVASRPAARGPQP